MYRKLPVTVGHPTILTVPIRVYGTFSRIRITLVIITQWIQILHAGHISPIYHMYVLKSIIVGYSLPKKLLNQTALSNVDFSMALNNFFTFTSYKGMDPETPGATYPVSRSVMFSVNVGF